MTHPRRTLKAHIKLFNAEVLKLSWVYIIGISLILLVIVQLYKNSTTTTPPVASNPQLEMKINNLSLAIEKQAKQIEQLKKEIDALKQK